MRRVEDLLSFRSPLPKSNAESAAAACERVYVIKIRLMVLGVGST